LPKIATPSSRSAIFAPIQESKGVQRSERGKKEHVIPDDIDVGVVTRGGSLEMISLSFSRKVKASLWARRFGLKRGTTSNAARQELRGSSHTISRGRLKDTLINAAVHGKDRELKKREKCQKGGGGAKNRDAG